MLTNLSVERVSNGWVLHYSIRDSKTGIVTDACDIYSDSSPLLDRIKELISMQLVVEPVPVEPEPVEPPQE